MAALIVASWYCSARAQRQPVWGAFAGLMAALAFFTKASAAFYLGALGLVAGLGADRRREPPTETEAAASAESTALWTLAGLALSVRRSSARCFVLPHWADYRFYNWQVSVTRKPRYDLASIAAAGYLVSDPPRYVQPHVGRAAAWRCSAPGASRCALAARGRRRTAAPAVDRHRVARAAGRTTTGTNAASCS